MSVGFSFGTPSTQQTTSTPAASGGFAFGTPAASGGGFGTAPTTAGAAAGGFGGFGSTPAAAATTQSAAFGATPAKLTFGGGGLGTTATPATTAPTVGFALGAPAKTTAGFAFGTTTTSSGLGGLGAATTTTAQTGFALGGALGTTAATTSATPGFNFGAGLGAPAAASATTSASTGFSLGTGLGSTATTTTSTGLGLGGLGTFGATPSTSGAGLSLGTAGLGGLGAATTTASTTTTVSRGLGGVDPQTTSTAVGSSSTNGKPGDAKAVKEGLMPDEICTTVEDFKKYVKEQKGVREEIARMSSKQMLKVQEEVASLKQLLSLVTNGLQRNAVAINKLRLESAQELKNAEIAQRTKDTPPGLQYENTAPNDYFAHLVEDFEVRMVMYRQQIEEMESHLASMNQPCMLTPQELSLLLKKLQESFINLAAQLQVVHEVVADAIPSKHLVLGRCLSSAKCLLGNCDCMDSDEPKKTQKDHYLNYRKVILGDTSNLFENRRRAAEKAREKPRVTTTVGPTPFTGMSNAAAVAMATALSRTQQPGAPAAGMASTLGLGGAGLGAPGLGQTAGLGTGIGAGLGTGLGAGTGSSLFGGAGTGTGFGSVGFGTSQANQTQAGTSGFGSFAFGGASTAAVRPLGSTFGSTNTGTSTGFGGFGSTNTGTGFGTSGGGLFNTSTGSSGFGTAPVFGQQSTGFGQPGTPQNQGFQLQKPPVGNKRGKKS